MYIMKSQGKLNMRVIIALLAVLFIALAGIMIQKEGFCTLPSLTSNPVGCKGLPGTTFNTSDFNCYYNKVDPVGP